MKINVKKLFLLIFKHAFGKHAFLFRLKSGYLQSMKQIPFLGELLYLCELL